MIFWIGHFTCLLHVMWNYGGQEWCYIIIQVWKPKQSYCNYAKQVMTNVALKVKEVLQHKLMKLLLFSKTS
jgi:hypothetical protein